MEIIETKAKGSVTAVMFLVAGTCIGAGMLALPVVTGSSGFIPSLFMMFLCCAFMAATGLLFVEVNLWLGPGAHVISMSGTFLGWPGKIVAGLLYLFISYASLVAYTAGGGDLFALASKTLTGVEWCSWSAALTFALVFGGIIYFGRRFVGRVNALLFIGMMVAYLLLVLGGISEVSLVHLVRRNWSYGFYALPLILTTFSYQAVVPSLVTYLDGDAKRLRTAIIGGTIIALLVYAAWQWLIIGVVPYEGEHGLAQDFRMGQSATQSFRFHAKSAWLASVSEFFAFFAIVTSYLGMGLGLFDFLADAFKVKSKGWLNSLWLMALVVIPTYYFAVNWERAFLVALDTTGGVGDTILNGMIPVLMIWSGRYIKERKGPVLVGGGQPVLLLIFAFALLVFGVEILQRLLMLAPIEDPRALTP